MKTRKKQPILDKEYNMSVEMVSNEFGYSQTYIRSLARQENIPAKQIRNRWHFRYIDWVNFLKE